MKTPMEKLFEKLEARETSINTRGVIWESIKHNFFLAEEKAMGDQYWKGYKEGQHSGDKTAKESYDEEYRVSPQDTPVIDNTIETQKADRLKESIK